MTLALDPTTLPPALKGWLGAHTAFRRDAEALVNAVAAHDPSDTAAAARLADAFAISKQMLEEHHATEDELVFPELIARSPAFSGVVMTMSLEHVDLDDVVDDMTRALNVLTAKTSRNDDVHERLTEQAETFRELINLHLDVEEEYALPMFLRHLTIEEIDSIGDQHLARNADMLQEMVPWVASALSPEAATAMLAGMPQDVQENFAHWNIQFQHAFAPMLSQNAHAVAA